MTSERHFQKLSISFFSTFSLMKELLSSGFLCPIAVMIPPETCMFILTGVSRSVDLCGIVPSCVEVQEKTLCLQTNELTSLHSK